MSRPEETGPPAPRLRAVHTKDGRSWLQEGPWVLEWLHWGVRVSRFDGTDRVALGWSDLRKVEFS